MYDIDIREAIFDYLDDIYDKYRIIEEKTMGKSRADIIMVLEALVVGFEIKSDSDTYERLKRQIKDYDKFCDLNYIVVGKSHQKSVHKHIPNYWGIIAISLENNIITIDRVREPEINPKVKINNKLKWLWRIELNNILLLNNMPKYKQKSKKFVQDKILEKVPVDILHEQISEELFERDYTLCEKKRR